MSVGLIVLIAAAVLILLGLAHRVLDRMNLSDTGALLFLIAMVVGSFLPNIPLMRGEVSVSVNIGGALVPLALVLYLLSRTRGQEVVRSLFATVVVGVATYALAQITDFDPGSTVLDPVWIYGVVAGVVGYLFGRSRRSAFISGVLGLLINDVVEAGRALATKTRTDMIIGGAGVLDGIVLAGLVGVLLAEIFGEIRERVSGGPSHDKSRSQALDNDEFRREEFGDELGSIRKETETGFAESEVSSRQKEEK